MPQPPDIVRMYQRLRETREPFLQRGKDIAELTMPWLAPTGEVIREAPFSSLGTQAVQSLGSSVQKIMMPPHVQWYRLSIGAELERELEEQLANKEQVDEVLARINEETTAVEDEIASFVQRKNIRSTSATGIRRNLLEGNTLFHLTKAGLRTMPLRSFVVKREKDGSIRFVISREEMKILHEDLEEKIKSEPTDTPKIREDENIRDSLFTWIDYDNGEVWQIKGDEEKPVQVEDVDPVQWFVLVPTLPDVEDYAVGYAYEYFGLINELNNLSESFGEIAAAAAVNLQFVKPEGPQPRELESQKSGEWRVGDWEMLGNYTPGIDPSRAAPIVARITDIRSEIERIFAMGLKDRAIRAATATEILQITQELETQTQDLLITFDETFQRPLLRAMMFVLGFEDIKLPENDRQLKLEITTGVNAVQREQALIRYLQIAGQVMAMDRTLKIDGLKVMDLAGDTTLLPTEGLVTRMSTEEIQALTGQLETQMNGQAQTRDEENEQVMTAGGPQFLQGGPAAVG